MKDGMIIHEAVTYIEAIQDEKIATLTPEAVATALNMNLNYLSDLFRNIEKISLPDFIRRERLHRAFFLLDEGRVTSISELAKLLRFADEEFEKEFERYYRVKPGMFQYLKKIIIFLNKIQGTKPLEEIVCQLKEIL